LNARLRSIGGIPDLRHHEFCFADLSELSDNLPDFCLYSGGYAGFFVVLALTACVPREAAARYLTFPALNTDRKDIFNG